MAHPRDERIAELQAQIEAAKAEIAELKAAAQTEKAEIKTGEAMNLKAAAEKSTAIGLEGERGQDGSFVEAKRKMTADEQKLYDALVAGDEMTEELQIIANNMTEQDFEDTGMPIVARSPLGYWDYTNNPNGEWISNFPEDEKRGDIAGSATHLTGETGEHGSGMDLTGQNKAEEVEIETTKTKPSDEVDMITEKQIADPDDDIEGDERTDAESEKMRHGGIDREQGRTKPVESDARSEKPGWETEEGSNTWSINEKDDYWKTQEGFNEAMDLYGQKPSWLKEPTLVYNPETDEYEEIEEEEFEDLSRPTVSADIKKLFG